MDDEVTKMLGEYAEGGLVSKNAMSDYFLASSGKMTEIEFVGKHKMSTLSFENKFQADNNVDIAGIESFSEINDKPKGVNMDYSKKPQMLNEGGEVDPVSGNDIPPGVAPENVRDDIPAMLSEGEYVVPADVLRYYGVGHFEKLRDKAKAAMLELDSGGRLGGEEADGNVEMAEGGSVEDPTQPTFDPSGYRTVGASAGKDMYGFSKDRKLASSAYEYREYTGPAGDIVKVLFVNGTAMGSVPEGYSPVGSSAVTSNAAPAPVMTPSPSTIGEAPDNYEDLVGTSDRSSNGGMGLGDPLSALDFSDPKSIETWASDRLSVGQDNKGYMIAGGAAAGPLGAGLAGVFSAARDIAVVNAAALAAYDSGNKDLGDQLTKDAKARAGEVGILGLAPKSLFDGKNLFANFVENKSKTEAAQTKAQANQPSATDFNISGIDSSIDRSGFDDTQTEAVRSSSRPQSRPDGPSSSGSSFSGRGGGGKAEGGLITRRNKQPK